MKLFVLKVNFTETNDPVFFQVTKFLSLCCFVQEIFWRLKFQRKILQKHMQLNDGIVTDKRNQELKKKKNKDKKQCFF